MVRVQKDFSAWAQVWCYDIAEFLMSVASEVRPYVAINTCTGETLYMVATSYIAGNSPLRWDFRNSRLSISRFCVN
jgi:hypothetical protein